MTGNRVDQSKTPKRHNCGFLEAVCYIVRLDKNLVHSILQSLSLLSTLNSIFHIDVFFLSLDVSYLDWLRNLFVLRARANQETRRLLAAADYYSNC